MYIAAESLSRLIGFDPQLLFDAGITAINVFILFFALSYLLFNPAQNLLKKRSEKIKTELENAKTKEEEAIKLKEEYQKKLEEVKVEINDMLENARKNAKNVSDEMINNAKQEAARIIERGNKEVELEKDKALSDVKDHVINISTLMASKALKDNMSVKIDDKIFEDTLKEIGEVSWQN